MTRLRTAVVPGVMTAFVAIAGLFLATGGGTFEAFFFLVPRSARTELPLLAALVMLVVGASIAGAVARHQGIARFDDVAAALLATVGVPLAAYLAFELRFWPAFAADRVTYGIDLGHMGPLAAVGALAAYFALAWTVTRVLGPSRAPSPTSRATPIALITIAGITVLLAALGLSRLRAHPRGYLAELRHVPVPVSVAPGSSVRIEDLCVFGIPEPKHLDVVVVDPSQPCPANGYAGRRLDASTLLLRDAAHDAWFGPSEYGSGEYRTQLVGPGGVVTLHDVGAPPPLGIVYAAWMAVGTAAILALETRRRRRPPPRLGVAIAGLFAVPLWVGAAVGIVL